MSNAAWTKKRDEELALFIGRKFPELAALEADRCQAVIDASAYAERAVTEHCDKKLQVAPTPLNFGLTDSAPSLTTSTAPSSAAAA